MCLCSLVLFKLVINFNSTSICFVFLHFQSKLKAELNSGILFRTVIQNLYPDKNQILDIKSQIDFFIAYFISRVGHKRLTLHALCQKCKNHFIKTQVSKHSILGAKIQSLPLLDRRKMIYYSVEEIGTFLMMPIFDNRMQPHLTAKGILSLCILKSKMMFAFFER